ncbi:nucleoside-diphosphate sugar epimerase/dehydratase [Bacillus paranthracis]|uniref:polysaccharide biosynthesis protein n=1 Tax=Bacillus TaxID=1386 RepID=UPI0022DF4172|nr:MULTISPECIES: nucleoside-diphosphate sugar epimerase/dehydratase [Bacillus cereus group]MDA1745327.1 nucleoside-diphosphate sugar epimerase/dehydratase [Bacillus cereus group sp. LD121LC]MDK7421075.1 nucleoside-diphosphate sugar epimerase/dehydratase [Bacillus paranthracis]MDK7431646.1 nucleoside-diphosphate sugar epimerase/dehydratase [Bacillus paranthracis]MDK7517556.1 nucleoside-diphosphate sugar epimerase/dehydratase [Bacillus paranthracis]MDK7574087.1 nucleoside-diphosphate sugar epime
MSYRRRLSLLILLDSFIVLTAVYLSYWFIHPNVLNKIPMTVVISSITLLCSHHVFAAIYKLYNKAWEYASIGELKQIFKAITLSILVTAIVQQIINHDVYVRILAIAWMLHLLLIGGSRFVWRMFRDTYITKATDKKRTLIIGAGSAGTMVVRQLQHNKEADLYPIAFVDDDRNKQKLEIYNVPVIGTTNHIQEIVEDNDIEHIIIAIPSLNRGQINEIFEKCRKTKAKTQIVPMLEDLLDGKVSVNEFRDVQVEDLLGREPIQLDDAGIGEKIAGKTILVTGAGGSIGSEICRQVMKYKPAKIVLLGHGENSIYNIEMEMRVTYKDMVEITTEIADIQDRHKIFEIMKKHQPYIVYHAAAHKHVPLMERNPEEAVKNNIFGTKNVAEAADTFKVNTFVMVSTDKAVNPTNVMGATKRFAEMLVQHMASVSTGTRFVAVRFGNVLGSRGSVIPLFKKQIQKGGPVTVTHPDMIRYFMTIPEASRLVIQAGTLARGGELFVLDMGDPVKIVDLAKNLITLSGYSIEEIGIEFTGLRPGEKMYEELLNEGEIHPEQIFPKIHIGKAVLMDQAILRQFMNDFEGISKEEIRERLLDIANNKVNLNN